MKTIIKTYNGQKATFYIQSKGLHAGRPLKEAIPNSFAVTTKINNAYEIVYSLWRAKAFYNCIIGSVIPFIRVADVKKIVLSAFDNVERCNQKNLKKIEVIDNNIETLEKQIALLKEMRDATAHQTIRLMNNGIR